jgi:hypothetical protein
MFLPVRFAKLAPIHELEPNSYFKYFELPITSRRRSEGGSSTLGPNLKSPRVDQTSESLSVVFFFFEIFLRRR